MSTRAFMPAEAQRPSFINANLFAAGRSRFERIDQPKIANVVEVGGVSRHERLVVHECRGGDNGVGERDTFLSPHKVGPDREIKSLSPPTARKSRQGLLAFRNSVSGGSAGNC